MKEKELAALTEEQILQKLKKIKNNTIVDAGIIGLSVGIIMYSVVKNGFGLFAFLPLVVVYLISRNSAANKILEKDLKEELDNRKLS